MFTFTRNQIRILRNVFRAALGISPRGPGPSVTFTAVSGHLAVRATDGTVAIEQQLPGQAAGGDVTVPFAALSACQGNGSDPVSIGRRDNQVLVEWHDAGIPMSQSFDPGEPASWPDRPATMAANIPGMIAALRDASASSDSESSRYALGCLRLRGRDGQIAATDGRQAFLSAGYNFPWEEELLVPANRVFGTSEFLVAESVAIGHAGDWVAVQCDPWTLWLRIEKEARFPKLDDVIPTAADSAAILRVDEHDVQFLLRALKRLPASDEPQGPVTIDLNGSVAVRARAAGQPATELVLTRSARDGDEVRFRTNRGLLARALELGFREISIRGNAGAACCRDERRTYVWALLGQEHCVDADESTVRVESASTQPRAQSHPRRRPATAAAVAVAKRVPRVQEAVVQSPETDSPAGVIEQADALRESLAKALFDCRTLLSSLRKRNKQHRLMRDTIASLRRLQEVA